MKASVLGSFLNKVVGLKPATLLKRDTNTGVFLLRSSNEYVIGITDSD